MLRRTATAALVLLASLVAASVRAAGVDLTSTRWTVPLVERCPSSPASLELVPGVSRVETCPSQPATHIHGLQSSPHGWIVYASHGLEAFDESGHRRWHTDNRANCWRFYGSIHCAPLVSAFVATADGGAWILENDGFPETHYLPTRLRRIRPDGSLGDSLDLSDLENFGGSEHRLLAEGTDGVVLLWTRWETGWDSIGQLRWSGSTTPSFSRIHVAVGTNEIYDARLLGNGDVLIAFSPNAHVRYCLNCYDPLHMAVARAARDGELLWRREADVVPAADAVLSDEAVWVTSAQLPVRLQQVSSDGTKHPPIEQSGFGVDETPYFAAGIGGELLLLTQTGVKRVAPHGGNPATAVWEGPGFSFWRQPSAPLVAWPGTSASVLDILAIDPVSLIPTLRGVLAERPSSGVYPYVAAGDGGSYALLRNRQHAERGLIAELARFDAPGSKAADRLHRNGFEP